MNKILKFSDFLLEKQLVLKRKYKEYPQQKVSTSAKVRNTIFNAMQDGVITDEEMEQILNDINAHKKWLSKNSKLFKKYNEDGIKKVALTKYGKKIKSLTNNDDMNINDLDNYIDNT